MSIKNIAVMVSGNGSNLQAIIDASLKGTINAKVALVISNRENAYALERAKKHLIKTLYIGKKINSDDSKRDNLLLKALSENKIDLIVLAGYLDILNEKIVSTYNKRIINIHPSLIPKYCGKGFYGINVHKAVIENREKISGATVHYVDSGIDTGEIILSKSVVVEDFETPEFLQKKVLAIEHEILINAINKILKETLYECACNW